MLKILEAQKHSITLVEENTGLCEDIAAESGAMVMNGDVTNPEILDEIKVKDSEFVFAVTGNEETNFLAAVYAKQAGAKKVISRVSEAKHSILLQRLGVETVIPEFTLARELANRVSSPTIFRLLNPLESNVELVERRVDSGMSGKSIGKVNENQRYNIIATFHEGKFRVAKPNDKLEDGMKVIVVREK